MSQEFNGPVEQVAGRDIHNYGGGSGGGGGTLWDNTTEELLQERLRCQAKLRGAWFRQYLNVPAIWTLCGLMLMLWMLLSGRALSVNVWVLWGTAFAGIVAPSFWLQSVQRRERHALSFYRQRIAMIDFIVADRR